ncbi:MAG: fibronectin type III domain-containing protein [bacterium]|nr:fibronectin type III domain-containing protein [bacterium]
MKTPRFLLTSVSMLLLFLFLTPLLCFAQTESTPPIVPPTPPPMPAPLEVAASDVPNDGGSAIRVSWQFPNELEYPPVGFEIFRYEQDGSNQSIVKVQSLVREYIDTGVTNKLPYSYRVQAIYRDSTGRETAVSAEQSQPASAHITFFDFTKINLAIITLILLGAILGYIFYAGRGKEMTIRKIAGVAAIEEAVGRSTEMGKPVLFVPGTQDMDNVQTIAGLTILASVARMTAKYEARLDVPVSRSITMSTGRETVHEAYLASGRPDLYSDDIVHYITDEQFGFVAAIDGIMVRDKPAACIYMGAFFAESLILAETGNGIGAIQIAGTAMPTQLPFFVAACDYTLIGEELFAASAYLSGDQRAIGSLKGQDVGKAVAMLLILFTSLAGTVAAVTGGGAMEKVYQFLWRLTAASF